MAKPPKYITYFEAQAAARELLGANGVARFIRTAPSVHRFTLGQVFEQDGIKQYGVIASGRNWPQTIDSLKRILAEYEAHKHDP